MQTKSGSVKRLRDVHAEATRQALVSAACERFVTQGYASTSLEDIAAAAGTTKGAIYHHFRDKRALFAAVYELLSQELIGAIAESEEMAQATVEAALHAFVHRAGQPRFQRVLFKDGPVVLGAQECRAIDMRYSLGLITQLIGLHAPESLIKAIGLDILARLLLSSLVEAAQILASAENAPDTSERVLRVMNQVVKGLLQP